MATVFTILWMTAVAVWALLLHFNRDLLSYATFSSIRLFLSMLFTLAAGLSLWGYHRRDIFRAPHSTSLGQWAVAGLVFWVLFPPIWFFIDYHGAVTGALSGADKDSVKAYADFSSKIWAAFLALYLFTVTQRVKAREEEIKRNDKKPLLPTA